MASQKTTKNKGKNKDKKEFSREEVSHLAHLVRLELSEEEIKMFQDQLGDTIDYVQNLSELETEGVKGLSHTTDTKNVTFEDGEKSKRTFSQEDAVANAKKEEDGSFVVDKILDK